MLDVFGFPTPQGANYQAFYGGGTVRDWVKPRGASMVRMLLIGAGGSGAENGGAGGGSGAVTQWIGPAIFIPDVLRVSIGAGGNYANGTNGGATSIIYQAKNGTGYTLLSANGGGSAIGVTGAGGTAATNNYFGAAGVFNSIAGQAGTAANASRSASTTTFLSGGAGGSNASGTPGGDVNCNYGYPTLAGGTNGVNGKNGFFITQPIMLGVGGSGGGYGATTGASGGKGGIGCGGGSGGAGGVTGGKAGDGGDGAVFIWSW